jgi:integrase
MPKITKRSIDALKAQDTETFLWDSELRGFGVRVSPRGKKIFVVQYRSGGRTRRMKLGNYGSITPDEARASAKRNLGDVANGNDPSRSRQQEREAPNVTALCDKFLREYAAYRCKPRTQKEYELACRLHIKPKLGGMKVQSVSRLDVSDLHHAMRKTPYQANRVLSVLSKMFNLCEVWGLRPDGSNPTRHVQKYREKQRNRFLSPDEIGLLWTTLDTCVENGTETPYVANAFKLLLLTGCRLSEIQKMKWNYVRGDVLLLPDAKTGPRRVLLSAMALHVLRQLSAISESDFVIEGKTRANHVTDLQKPWRRIRAIAGLSDVRIHDLRHTYASIAAMTGHSLPMIGKLIGHTQAQTTARYAHLADSTTRKAANEVDDMIAQFTGASEGGQFEDNPKIIPMGKL